MTFREQLILICSAYADAAHLSEATVSSLVFNGGKVIDRIKGGGDVSTGNFEKYLQWFSDNWPTEAAWPAGVKRPVKTKVLS